MAKKIGIIGSGFAGLSAACHLAQKGFEVHVFEKNSSTGGRARSFQAQGFTFDMGPSWYWMPEIFEEFFSNFGYRVSDFYELVRLDPSYQVIFEDKDRIKLPADYEAIKKVFDQYEQGSGEKLDRFLKDAAYKYSAGMNQYVRKPSLSPWEFLDGKVLSSFFRLNMFSSISSEIRKLFTHEKLIQILEFPVLFLGAMPQDTPALYSLMNFADIKGGTWYPMNGMDQVPAAMEKIALELGVHIHLNQCITGYEIDKNQIKALKTGTKKTIACDAVLCAADYHHGEQLLPPAYRSYTDTYWDDRKMAPSSLLFYIGLDHKIPDLLHHNLFFDADFNVHAHQIYKNTQWPDDPLFYICCPSKTDPSVAPPGSENIFILIPLAPDLHDTPEERERQYQMVCKRLHSHFGVDINDHLVYKKSYCVEDFKADYNAFKGNAYGLANTLMQTAFLKPKMRSKKLSNLFYAGQLTVPGPGVPPSLISGHIAANLITETL